jgi:cell division protein FtsL
MTAAEKVIFALTWPVVAPLLLVLFIAVLLTAFPVILLAGSVPIDEGSNG